MLLQSRVSVNRGVTHASDRPPELTALTRLPHPLAKARSSSGLRSGNARWRRAQAQVAVVAAAAVPTPQAWAFLALVMRSPRP